MKAAAPESPTLLKFQVQNLGKVRSAEIELAPLSILVGKNNTGKSYVATLIWSLDNLRRLLDRPESKNRRPRWFQSFIDLNEPNAEREIDIDDEKREDIVRYFNDVLKRGGASFLSSVFAHNGFGETKIQITTGGFAKFKIRLSLISAMRGETERDEAHIHFVDDDENVFLEMAFPLDLWRETTFFADRIFEEIVNNIIHARSVATFNGSIYIPAARTGLMLALGSLVSDSLGSKDANAIRELPLPLVSFLRAMARPQRESRGRATSKLAAWLRENVTHGSIEARRTPSIPEFRYKPEGMDVELPLHATSSMITELAPFLVSLSSDIKGRHLILEEPEAHLHLEAQREMARAIARMVSLGAQVTLTTHSDTFLQQINNLMSLHDHPKRNELMKRFGYDKTDLIDPAKVEAYEFHSPGGVTDVRRVKRTSEGLVVSSLNETLLSLAHETLAIRERSK